MRLAVGLAGHERVEVSAFWIGRSSLFGRFSAPVGLEAGLFERGHPKALRSETFFGIWGGPLKAHAQADPKRREIQIRAGQDRALDKVFKDLQEIASPAKPRGMDGPLPAPAATAAPPGAMLHPAPCCPLRAGSGNPVPGERPGVLRHGGFSPSVAVGGSLSPANPI